ncbi:balbiani ring protein 3-like [Frankliniella occidentalis]|uniref:Balbiani ring protein 3-like n=1 Tax=Frankliniella occidentalis TaxID=133901 RepID=A0A9C6X0X2_FRAOC|nr:balbiani ring protein 3-like [Frankliniella occidentalis]
MSLNALVLVPLALVVAIEYSSAETSSTSTTDNEARSAIEEWKEWDDCHDKRNCRWATCTECDSDYPGDEGCKDRCKDQCRCSCAGYQRDGVDPGLWEKCKKERRCNEKYIQCTEVATCQRDRLKCICECMQLTRSRARVAIPARTTCSPAKEIVEEWDRCTPVCRNEEHPLWSECSNWGWHCLHKKILDCECVCAGLLARSTESYEPTDRCEGGCGNNLMSCLRDLRETEIERINWCLAYHKKCMCACLQQPGATSSNIAAEYKTTPGDRAALELCAYAQSCHTATCECREGDAECVSQCRDSCRCGCLSFPAAGGPDVQPVGRRLTVNQCRDKSDACLAVCTTGDNDCRDGCFVEREMCNCKCAGRSSRPPPPSPTDSGDKNIVMYCNYLS